MLKTQNYSKLIGILLFCCFLFSNNAYAAQTGVVNFTTSKAGVYRITYEQLVEQGVDLRGVKNNKFALTHGDTPVYLKVLGKAVIRNNEIVRRKNFFGSGGSITFIAESVDSQYTDDVVYTLHVNRSLRKAIKNKNAVPNNAIASQEYYQATYEYEEQNDYTISAGNENDPWTIGPLFAFGAPGSTSYSFDLDGFEPTQGDVTASFDIVGGANVVEAPDHHAQLSVNGILVDDQEFDGFDAIKLSGVLSGNQLTGTNDTIEVTLPYDLGLPFDYVLLDKFDIQYPRKLNAINNELIFDSDAGQMKVASFDSKATVYQKFSDGSIYQLVGTSQYQLPDNTWVTEFAERNLSSNKNKRKRQLRYYSRVEPVKQYFAVTEESYLLPEVSLVAEQQNITSGAAEYLIITHPDFYGDALDRLVQLRQAKYTTKVVDVNQIYAQFGTNVPEPSVIKDYIKYAVENLSTKMVVLVGGDTYDYKNYTSNSVSFIPTPYFPAYSGNSVIRFSPSDASYGDLDEDDVPEIPIGRLPVRTTAELAIIVDKLEDYKNRSNLGSASYDRKSVFVADHLDNGTGYSFTNDAEALINLMPQAWKDNITDAEKAYLEQDGGVQAKTELLNAINNGVSLVSFVGHSNFFQWSFSNPVLFNTTDATNLLNIDKPSVFVQWGCWNTFYVFPDGNSLAQILLLNGNNGAATVLGASTLTQADTERGLADFLYQEMFVPGKPLGQAVIEAKQAYYQVNPNASDVFLGWQILGDPAIEIEPAL